MGADIIHVIDKGTVVETGSHNTLMSQNGIYSRLYEMQFETKKKKF